MLRSRSSHWVATVSARRTVLDVCEINNGLAIGHELLGGSQGCKVIDTFLFRKGSETGHRVIRHRIGLAFEKLRGSDLNRVSVILQEVPCLVYRQHRVALGVLPVFYRATCNAQPHCNL